MSHILIIGGMGPQASIYAHRRLIDVAYHRGARTNEDYPQITHLSINVPDFISNTTQRDKARAILIKALESIDSESVTAGFIACNTAHMLYEDLTAVVSADKIVSIIDATRARLDAIRLATPSVSFGILASPSTIKSNFYDADILPSASDIDVIEDCIRNLIANAEPTDVAPKLQTVIDNLRDRGATHVVLGCTELSMLNDYIGGVEIIDPIDIVTAIVTEKD